MTTTQFAAAIDHTLLKPEAEGVEIHRLGAEAMEYGFAAVCVAPVWVARMAVQLRGSGVKVCTVAGFPHGTAKPIHKAIEATGLIKDGADEVDIVAHLPNLARADVEGARTELREIARACRATRPDVILKVIVESAYLLRLGDERGEAAIRAACVAIRESGCDFIKTSTGFHPAGGATVQAVRLMKKYGEGLRIKAAGGIRDLATATTMLDAGADRLGMSASVAVLQEFKRMAGG